MALPYPYVTNNLNHINTGSYLDQKETGMLVTGYSDDLWYGFGETDVIELSVFDLDQNPLGWKTINSEKKHKTVTLTYLDSRDRPVEYSYQQLISDFTLYKNTKILVNPVDHLEDHFGIVSGSYILTYNFMREMAGTFSTPLVVKDISPSRKELKIIPEGNNTPRYEAFCKKKFLIKDVAPLLLQLTAQCPYDQIYSRIKDKYAKEVAFLKQLLFLTSDGAFVAFLKTLYEDVVVYTNPTSPTQIADKIKRIQGIKTYYQNLLLSNYESISDFFALDDAYDTYAIQRIEQQFKHYGTKQGPEFFAAKKFLVEFFTTEFYHPITVSTKTAFDAKYYSYLKNALNLGNNQMFIIVDHSFVDERLSDTDPLTLLIKLKTELPDDIKIQTSCWVSNVGITPFVINAIIRKSTASRTVKIAPPDFRAEAGSVSFYNSTDQFTADDLRNTISNQESININKKISELHVDYTDFSKFILFSSAQQRLVNFKDKISTWYILSSSVVTLDSTASASLANGQLYPRYTLERDSLTGRMTDIVSSFDGYESFLYKSGSYTYSAASGSFVNSGYIADQDYSASIYDKTNRDSLVNNTPDHIVLDENNDDYLMFLNMVGHFFDNIYLYIQNLPSEKVVANDPSLTFSKKMIDHMLDSFGWKVGTTYEDSTTVDTYITASSLVSYEDQTKAIRTRLLTTLPQIYKTKGTEEAIKLVLSCYGIPSTLLDIREYGNDDYTTASLVTYTKQEQSALISLSGSGIVISQNFAPRPNVRTMEVKLLFHNPELYLPRKEYTFVDSYHNYTTKWDYNWSVHTVQPSQVAVYEAIGYYSIISLPSWKISFVREYGNMGRITAELPTYSASLYINGYNGTFSGSFSGVAGIASGSISSSTSFGSSYFTGSVDGAPAAYVSGTFSGSVVGTNTGSIRTFLPVSFVGVLTGSNSTDGNYTGGTFTQLGVTYGVTSPISNKIAYGHPRIRLTSSLFPLFDGDIFNIRLRRNTIDPAFQYFANSEVVPTVYDLTVQRNERGRRIFRSIDSAVGYYEDNMVWDGISTFDPWEQTGSLGTTTTQSILIGTPSDASGPLESFVHIDLGNTMVWDVPISDSDFEVHCNDFSSFAYSGSNAETHLITRIDAEEPSNFITEHFSYYYGDPYNYGYGYALGNIPNRSEYYSTFNDLYSDVVASGSWTGAKTGSLYTLENFTGSLKGSLSGSMSGSGHGYFLTSSTLSGPDYVQSSGSSYFNGYISGSMTGSFNGQAAGVISSSAATAKGRFGYGFWSGETYSADNISRSLFVGTFSGSATGSFPHSTVLFGTMTSSLFGTFRGARLGGWTGSFTGSLTGSMQCIYMSGTFLGNISGSVHNIPSIGTYSGTSNRIWYGALTGSFTGSWTGSSGEVWFTGSSPYNYENGQTTFSGSFKGSISSSVSDNIIPRNIYATGSFSGSFLQQWTGSPVVLYNKPIMPVSIGYYSLDYWTPRHYTTSSTDSCGLITDFYTPAYPYEYVLKDIEKTYTTPSYGPNRFKNEKIKSRKQSVASRLSTTERSTADLVNGVSSDSNLIGLYLDPQDAKNRDIVKYYGNNDVVNLIADPSNMFSSSYAELKPLNEKYNSFGDRRVLYNELITLYKIYFNRSVFDSIKNVIPARSSVRTGILVEPTVLERPKYQHRPVFSEANTGSVLYFDVTASHYFRDPITKLMRFSGSHGNTSNGTLGLLFGEFNTTGVSSQSLDYTTLPPNPTMTFDVSYINEANFDYPINYNNGYYPDLLDTLQIGNYGSLGITEEFPNAAGMTMQEDLDTYTNASGSGVSFLVKKWDRYTIYFKSGSYSRISNKLQDVYVSQSVWLYRLVGMSSRGYQTLFYTENTLVQSGSVSDITDTSDLIIHLGVPHYLHRANTAVKTPNQRINTIRGTDSHMGSNVVAIPPYSSISKDTYFELFNGYPRNHYTHKRMQFSPAKFVSLNGKFKVQSAQIYIRGQQTVDTTIDDQSGLGDASLPVQTIQTSNVNVVQSDNVINQ